MSGSPRCPVAWGHWLLGHARDMARAPHVFAADVAAKAGGVGRFRILQSTWIAVSQPESIYQVLVGRHESYVRSRIYERGREINGNGLLATEGPYWRKQRRLVQPAFARERLSALGPIVAQALAPLLDRWEDAARAGRPVEIVGDMQRLALNVIGRALLGDPLEDERATEFAQGVRDSLLLMKQAAYRPVPLPRWWPSPFMRRIRRTRRTLDDYVGAHLAARRRDPAARGHDMLSVLMGSRDPETGEPMPDDALMNELRTLFIAGFETTANAFSWTLYLLARNPRVAERWHQEVDQVLGGAPPTWADLDRLGFVEQIVKEGLRLYPPVYNFSRDSTEAGDLGGCPVAPRQLTMLAVWGVHRSPRYWEDALAFDPDRFAPERASSIPRGAYLPFGLGKHTCIGIHFAMAEMTLALAHLGQRFRLALVEDREPRAQAQITLVPGEPIPLRLTSRRLE